MQWLTQFCAHCTLPVLSIVVNVRHVCRWQMLLQKPARARHQLTSICIPWKILANMDANPFAGNPFLCLQTFQCERDAMSVSCRVESYPKRLEMSPPDS